MHANPGYRGLSVIPYPSHIQKVIKDVENKTYKFDPKFGKYLIYKGREMIPNFDVHLTKSKKAGDLSPHCRIQ